MNELYIQKLIGLVEKGAITVDDIKDPDYKAEVERRISSQ